MLLQAYLSIVVKVKREDGFHIDLDDFLTGLLLLANELVSHTIFGNVVAIYIMHVMSCHQIRSHS